MKIAGLQKVSTVDYPGEICCVVFLHGCNFRCGFCYNTDLVVRKCDGDFSEEYVLDFLKNRIGKLDGVCVTGGEPLMSLDLGFVRKIKELGFKVKVDTNGSFPERLKELIDEGLVDYVAMDVKSCRDDYFKVVGADVDLGKIEASMKLVYEFGNYEFRTTIVSRYHNSENLVRMGKWMNDVCGGKPKRFFLQGFKSGHDMIDSSFKDEVDVSEKFLEELRDSVEGYFGKVEIRV